MSLRVVDEEGATDLIGFVTGLAPLAVEDRHGQRHVIGAAAIAALRVVGVALGRDPRRAPRDLLDDLAGRAGLDRTVEPTRHRISELVAGRQPPPHVFGSRVGWVGVDGAGHPRRARVEGEWLSTDVTDPELLVALAWWASRQDARSVQVRAAD